MYGKTELMKAFQLKRFGHTMVWTLRGERKNWLTIGVVTCAAYFLFLAYDIWKSHGGDVNAQRGTTVCLGMSCGVYVVFLTQFIANLKTKTQRLAYLSLPASPIEKYLSRLLYVSVLLPLTLPVSFVVADLLATLFAQVMGSGYVMADSSFAWSMTIRFFSGLQDSKVMLISYVAMSLLMALGALMTLCSVVFRQGVVVSSGVFVVVIFSLGRAIWWLGESGYIFHLSETEAKTLFGLVGAVLLLVALGELWLSYRVFRRLQVVPGRFTNL